MSNLAGVAIGLASATAVAVTGGAAAPFVSAAYLAGSAAGNMLFQKSKINHGSRIEDQIVTTSAIGNTIPLALGTVRISGNLIFQSKLRESYRDEKVGKGMGSVKNRTYSYHRDFAILLSCNKVTDITKIFANGELIFDKTDKNKGRVQNFEGDFIFYDGSADQMPDSTIESHEGIGNVNAMRGFCYVVFKNMNLTGYNGQVPNLTFQVVNSENEIGSFNLEKLENNLNDYLATYSFGTLSYNKYNECVYAVDAGLNAIIKYNLLTKRVDCVKRYDKNSELFLIYNNVNFENLNFNTNGDIIFAQAGFVTIIDKETLSVKNRYSSSDFLQYDSLLKLNFIPNNIYCYSSRNKRNYVFGGGYNSTNNLEHVQILELDVDSNPMNRKNIILENNDKSINYSFYTKKTIFNNQIYAFNSDKNQLYYLNVRQTYDSFNKLNRYLSLSSIDLNLNRVNEDFFEFVNDTSSNPISVFNMLIDSNNEFLYIFYTENTESKMVKYSIYQNKFIKNHKFATDGGFSFAHFYKNNELTVGLRLLVNTANPTFTFLNTESFEETNKTFSIQNYSFSEKYDSIFYYNQDDSFKNFLMSSVPNKAKFQNLYINRYKEGTFTVYNAIKELLKRTKLLDTEYFIDESLKNKEIVGMICANISSTRSYLQQIADYFFIDIVNSEWKIKFTDRNKDVSKTILSDDLSCVEYSENPDFSEDLTSNRLSESETTSEINLNYIDIDRDFQQSTQCATKLNTFSDEVESIDAPFSLNKDSAKQIAEKILYSRWIERDTFSFTTNLNYIDVDVGDCVKIETQNFDYFVKITRIERDNAFIKFAATSFSSNVLQQSGKGDSGDFNDQIFENIGKTDTNFLDIPILRNEDDGFGMYVSSSKQNEILKWNGSVLYKSKNNDSSFEAISSFNNSAKIGSAITVLQSEIFKNQLDPFSTVDVYIQNGILENLTDEQFYNFENIAILGNEIIVFQNAELINENTYRLSNLYRGRWNTKTTDHKIGDKFIMLKYEDLKRFNSDFNDSGINFYRNVTVGDSITNSNTISFKNTNLGLVCYNVSDIDFNINSVGDVSVAWKKRVRGNNNIFDGFDSFDLDGDNYSIDLYNNSNQYLKTYNTTSLNLTILKTELQQLNITSNFYLTIYKLNKYNERNNGVKINIV